MCHTALRRAGLVLVVLTAATARADVAYTVIDLGIPPGAFESLATGINNAGVVVGWSGHSFGGAFYRSWTWTPAEGLTLLPVFLVSGDVENYAAMDINDGGVIAGDGSNVNSSGGLAWRFQGGAYSVVPLLAGDTWSVLTGINAAGGVAGFSDNFSPGGLTEAYFFYSDDTGLVTIPESPGQITNLGRVNDPGQVVGTMGATGAFRWTVAGGFQFLGAPPVPFSSAQAWGVNNAGDACGMLIEDNDKYGAIFIEGAGWQAIADFALPGCCSDPRTERAEAINASREVVGWSALNGGANSGAHVAWVWSAAGGVRLLDDVIDPALNVHLRKALDINDAGQIVAYGSDNDLPEPYRAFLLTPVPAADLDGDGAVGIADFLALLAAWGPCPGSPDPCPADLDGDGAVGVTDMLALLADWG